MPGSRESRRIETALIIGAGPAGLWAAFQLGIHGLKSILIDSQDRAGGQCAALYADKPVYDVPGFAAVDAGNFANAISDQLARFNPTFYFKQTVADISRKGEHFSVITESAESFSASYIVIATGLGPLGIEGKPESLRLPDGIEMQNGLIGVNSTTFETGCAGIFAIGDCTAYPGKLCLLVSAFHEAALMAFSIRKQRAGGKRAVLEYSSTSSQIKSLFADR